jgi:large repetitive protein
VITNSTISNNSSDSGPGGLAFNSSTVTISNSTIADNTVSAGDSGGITFVGGDLSIVASTISGNSAVSGGGIVAQNNSTVTIINSTFSNNSADFGAGVYISGASVNVTNSTFSNNSAVSGGGFYNSAVSTLTLTNTTVTGNSGSIQGGGLLNFGNATVVNSIIAGNTAPSSTECRLGINTFTTNTNNLFGTNGSNGGCSNGANDIVPVAGVFITAILDTSLANNSGSTQNHALVTGSLAIDAANNASCPANDQRGIARGFDGNGIVDNPQTGDCDIGAYEYVGAANPPTVINTNPVDGAIDVPVDTDVVINFSETMCNLSASVICDSGGFSLVAAGLAVLLLLIL